MTGGLIQIITFGAQDIFLIGNPEITFFKVVYRRYTFFSIETKEEKFDGIINFNEKITTRLSVGADLAHKMYLKIKLPKIDIKNDVPDDANDNVNVASLVKTNKKKALDIFDTYSKFIIGAINIIKTKSKSKNITSSLINSSVITFFNTSANSVEFQESKRGITSLEPVIINGITSPSITNDQAIELTNIELKINKAEDSIVTSDDKLIKIKELQQDGTITINLDGLSDLDKIEKVEESIDLVNLIKISRMVNISIKVKNNLVFLHKRFFDEFKKSSNDLVNAEKIANSNNINFSWIKRLGHFIINTIDVEIGGTIISRHYGDWLNVWYELSRNNNQDRNYDKMIGNVPQMTTYDTNIKPEYELIIPLQFWFCRNNGLSLPLVAMRYNDVVINVELRKLKVLISHDYTGNNIDNLIKIQDISLCVDYVYLARDERRKFAQSVHEYLIEQVQLRKFEGITNKRETLEINFEHPCKEIIWHSQTSKNINNKLWNEYGIKNGTKNTIEEALIEFNGYERFQSRCGNYFNYLQPLEYHSNTPVDGINVYSFSLKPEEFQPSGSCNFSKFNIANLHLLFDDEYIDIINENEDFINVRVYAVNYNVLRIMAGKAGLAFLF